MLFLDGVYTGHADGSTRFRWVKAPTSVELTHLAHTIGHRVGRYLEQQGLLERDAKNSYLTGDAVGDDPMSQLRFRWRLATQLNMVFFMVLTFISFCGRFTIEWE